MSQRVLSSDIKRIAHTTLPSLEAVFLDSKTYVERRLATKIFPGFVKNQVALCATAAISVGANIASSKMEYPGLADSFCIMDAVDPSSPITAASDSFLVVSGYSLQEVISQNLAFLQGPYTDSDAAKRIHLSLREKREASELVLHHRQDGEPFWDLLFLYPLKDEDGRIRHVLAAQINVSEGIGTRKDLVRVLNGGIPTYTGSDGSSDGGGPSDRASSWTKRAGDAKSEREPSVYSSREGHTSSSSSTTRPSSSRGTRFLPKFRKNSQPTVSPLPKPERPDYFSSHHHNDSTATLNKWQHDRFSTQRCQLPSPRNQLGPGSGYGSSNVYAFHMVLAPPPPPPVSGGIRGSSKKHSLKLRVAYYSEDMARLLSLNRGDDARHQDIFHVLAERANSPTVTKSFKALVRERVEAGKSTSVDLVVDVSREMYGYGRPGTADGMGSGGGGGLDVGFGSSTAAASEKADKKWAWTHNSGSSSSAAVGKQERIMSHWTPMRGAGGNLEWVVLTLTPGF
ncbi:hypothetical protein F4778DRAFT_776673 [Xylariomycetidae sp. FL2044]|nr:hypothetical protein F4778DRAFT_776673 [Xylariomycetidae sp. FL2044]